MLQQNLEWLVRVSLARRSWEGCLRQRAQRRRSAEAAAADTGRTYGSAGSPEGNGTGREDRRHWSSSAALGRRLSTAHRTPPAPPPQALAAGIEANIPVTYGIGSQRGDKSTGCHFIGQSPVHSVSEAC